MLSVFKFFCVSLIMQVVILVKLFIKSLSFKIYILFNKSIVHNLLVVGKVMSSNRNIKDQFPHQFGVVNSESGVHFDLADLLHGEKRRQSILIKG